MLRVHALLGSFPSPGRQGDREGDLRSQTARAGQAEASSQELLLSLVEASSTGSICYLIGTLVGSLTGSEAARPHPAFQHGTQPNLLLHMLRHGIHKY